MFIRSGRLTLEPKGQLVFLSDIHRESPSFNHKAWEQDLEIIKGMESPKILINGDSLTLILFNDKRFRGDNGIRYRQDALNFASTLLKDSLKDLWPNVVGIGRGNHETSVLIHNGFDLIGDLIVKLNTEEQRKEPIWDLGYTGYIELNFRKNKEDDKTGFIKRALYYHHGRGGGAPVTGGAIDLYRLNAMHRADYHWIGHIHKDITRGFQVTEYDFQRHRPVSKRIQGFVTPGYDGGMHVSSMTDEYYSDWATERIYGLQPHGFAYMDYEVIRKHRGHHSTYYLKDEIRRPSISEA